MDAASRALEGSSAHARWHWPWLPRQALAAAGDAAGPLALEMAAVRLAQALDLFWVGRLAPTAVAALAVGVTLRIAFGSLALGVAVGGMAVVARHTGRRNLKAAAAASRQTILLVTLLAAVPGAAGWAFAPDLVRALGIAGGVAAQAVAYLRITLLGLIPLALLPTLAVLLRVAGDAKRARAVLLSAAGLSAAAAPLLIFGCGPLPSLGVAGAALAALIGPAVGATLLLALLLRGGHLADAAGLQFREAIRVVRAGAPYGLQMAWRAAARVSLIAIVARFGGEAVAAYAIADAILMLALIPSYAAAEAAAALAVHCLRRGLATRAARGVWAAGAANLTYMGAVIVVLFQCSPQAIALFGATPRVVALGADALRVVSLGYLCSSLGVIATRGLDVTGEVVPAAAVNALTLWGVQVPAALLLSHLLGPAGVWMGLALGGAANGVLMSYRFRRGRGLSQA